MKDKIYLVMTRRGVDRMTKRMPDPARDEVLVTLNVEMADGAFRPPTISQRIVIADPLDGLDLDRDVELRQDFITEEEAEVIRRRRMGRMREILEDHGYEVKGPEDEEGKPS